MADQRRMLSTLLGLVGAAVGGALGVAGFGWFYSRGFYALILPGGLLGLGCGMLAQHPSVHRGVLCGVAGLSLGLLTEWWYRPFGADKSLGYFLAHLHAFDSPGVTWLMIAVGAGVAFWLGKDSGFAGGRRSLDG